MIDIEEPVKMTGHNMNGRCEILKPVKEGTGFSR